MALQFNSARTVATIRSHSLAKPFFRMALLNALLLPVVGLTGCTSEQDKILAQGQAIYKGTCKVCHAQGINGAPILGNNKMWAKRADQGLPTLVQHASQGYGLMPAKGGNDQLSEEEISSAVQYMLSQLN